MKNTLVKNVDALMKIQINEEIENFRLGKGKTFGDWGILYNMNQNTSALTLTDCVVITIDKDDFTNTIGVFR